ncbi:protein rep, partial [Escherichia coli]|uniref:protein rep n=1 Tax=Escherichia coli TaxID=562 RepID=UPI003979A5CD
DGGSKVGGWCLGADEAAGGHVRGVGRREAEGGAALVCATAGLVRGACAEALEDSTKPADRGADPEWFRELARQTRRRRFVATGGAPKDVLKPEPETDADMVVGEGISEGDDDGSRSAFEWKTGVRKYRRSPTKDKTESG